MRRLIIHRERALACFAMKYHCMINRDREEFLAQLREDTQPVHLWDEGEYALSNGQTISIPIEDRGCRFFVVACLDGRDLATDEVVVPPGEGDVSCLVRTDYDGNRRLGIRLIPAEA